MVTKEEQSRIGKSNSRKGKTHERRIATLLTEWTGEKFRRRRVEGRDSTVIERESTADVIPVSKDIYFSIEAKSGAGFSFDAILKDPSNSIFTKWAHQAQYDATLLTEVIGREIFPMLFFKPHPNFDWVVIPSAAIKVLFDCDSESHSELWFPHIVLNIYFKKITHDISKSKKNKKMVSLDLGKPIICRWYDFKNNVSPDSIFVRA